MGNDGSPLLDAEVPRIQRLLRGLPSGRWLARAITDLLKLEPVSFTTLRSEMSWCLEPTERAWREQELVCWALRHVDMSEADRAEAVGPLCKLGAGIEGRDWAGAPLRTTNAFIRTIAAPICLAVIWMVAAFTHWEADWIVWPLVMGVLALITLCFFLPIWSFRTDAIRCRGVRASALHTLGHLAHWRSLGTVASASLDRDPGIRSTAAEALPPIIESVRSEHYGQLGSRVVPDLCAHLRSPHERGVLMLLDALEKIGDGRAVEPVQDLAQRSRYASVRNRSAEILPTLLARRALETAQSTLLRASSDPLPAQDSLLRPAGAAAVAEEQLLRPTDV